MTSAELKAAENSKLIKGLAAECGFLHCSISKADFLEEEASRLSQWLKDDRHGKMGYMANHFDKRLDPRLLVPGSKSVVTLLYNYYNPQKQTKDAPKLSMYAYGEDYHYVVKRHMKTLVERIEERIGKVEGRAFVDSAPVLDKAWAVRSGAGWMGKHTNVIRKQEGSYFFIAELIIDLELTPDGPTTDHCGKCTACIDACPTGAIIQPYTVDGSRCISYFTIELKEAIPQEVKGQFDDWMFGCDICQEVCPWNRFAKAHNEPAFEPKEGTLDMDRSDWVDITKEVFNDIFRKSAVKRTGYEGLTRNIRFLGD
ncbi:MAG: tRNA epoxyqueuosine(34) reductase QueG [Flavobacteriales bacterium]|nr:tRNA epoxyqueuosine(34) reductase QueG [Flavobacteriales bacterium]